MNTTIIKLGAAAGAVAIGAVSTAVKRHKKKKQEKLVNELFQTAASRLAEGVQAYDQSSVLIDRMVYEEVEGVLTDAGYIMGLSMNKQAILVGSATEPDKLVMMLYFINGGFYANDEGMYKAHMAMEKGKLPTPIDFV